VLALKDNHPKLFDDVTWLFAHGDRLGWKDLDHSYSQTLTKAHGREEHRECWVLAVADIELLDNKAAWRDLHCIVRIRNTCKRKGLTSQEDRFFITSLPLDAQRIMRSVRFTGRLKTAYTGRLTWLLMKTTAVFALALLKLISSPYGIWLSAFSSKTSP
jgi:hypothetical protein